ncbi:uncharacterized protein [Anabrus simplex]|uniref:uncharacterized protein n=1 Tax=Anabrus simplex TaxID=316456 RepID=UPI0035A2BC20
MVPLRDPEQPGPSREPGEGGSRPKNRQNGNMATEHSDESDDDEILVVEEEEEERPRGDGNVKRKRDDGEEEAEEIISPPKRRRRNGFGQLEVMDYIILIIIGLLLFYVFHSCSLDRCPSV